MPQKGKRDLAKERYWRGVIADWEASGLTGAEYCRRHEIGYWQFQHWRKRLPRKDAADVVPRSGKGRRVKTQSHKEKSVEFLPVHLVDKPEPETFKSPATVKVVLRCGTVLRINSDCPPEFLSSIISVLENR